MVLLEHEFISMFLQGILHGLFVTYGSGYVTLLVQDSLFRTVD